MDAENNFLQLEIYYSLGGINYFTYEKEPRGFYLSIKSVKIEQKDGYRSVTSLPFNNYKMFVKETKRFSRKTMESIMAKKDWNSERLERAIKSALVKNNVTYTQETINDINTRIYG